MSRWAKYIGILLPLAGFLTPYSWLNVAVLPFIGGFIYGMVSTKRALVLSPAAALLPAVVVLAYYMLIEFARLTRYIFLFPIFVLLWIGLWVLFFSLGALAGYLARGNR